MERLDIMSKIDIERQAKSLLEQYGYSFEDDTYIDIVKFARSFGFLVGNATLDDNEDGFLVYGPDQKVIGVNENRSYDMKRFIIAHEFAHSVLHLEPGRVILHRENKKGKSLEENDADYFAAALLMPKETFEKEYLRLKDKGIDERVIWLQLSTEFKTPLESVVRRVKEIADQRL